MNQFCFSLLALIVLISGCSSSTELPVATPSPVAEQITPTTTEVTRQVLPTPTPTMPPSTPSTCGQLPPLNVISVVNAPQIGLLCKLQIPDYQRTTGSQCSLSFSHDGSLLAGVCGVNPAPVWDVQSGELRYHLLDEPSHQVAVTFIPGGDALVVGGFSGEVRSFDLPSGKASGIFSSLPSPVWDLDFNPSSGQLAMATFRDGIYWQDYPDGDTAVEVGDRQKMGTLSVDISPDGNILAFGTIYSGAWVVDMGTGDTLAHLVMYAPVGDLVFSPDGKWLVTGCDDHLIKIWSTADFSLAQTMTGHTGFVNGVAFSPDSRMVAAGSQDRTLTVWEVATGTLLQQLEGHASDVLRLEFNPQGTLIASISWDGTINLWGVVEP